MKKAFKGFIRRLDMAEEKISEHEVMPMKTFKTEMQIEKRWGKKNKISKNCGITINGASYV